MKKNYFFLVLLSLAILFSFVSKKAYNQNFKRCATTEYMNYLKSQDPNLEYKLQQQEIFTQQWVEKNKEFVKNSKTVITIPVIVHVVYNTADQNVSDAKILEQIDILNKDFRAQNTDITQVPSAWQSVKSDLGIEFCLAKRNPTGGNTTGIERASTTVTSFTTNSDMKYASSGGMDAWDKDRYLNIWICNLGSSGVLGFAQLPGGPAATDGLVLDYRGVGSNTTSQYNRGRTATHEIGHSFNLLHIWGDDTGSDPFTCSATCCTGTDNCGDTPDQSHAMSGKPTYPQTDACTGTNPGIMFMNYMDYVDDEAMFMFTTDQKTRAWALFSPGGYRNGLTTSNGCLAPGSSAELTLQNAGFGGENRAISSISIVDANNVWASAYDATGVSSYTEYIRTVNGGTNWIADTITGYSGKSIANISAASSSKAWVGIYDRNAGGGNIVSTTNGGTNWSAQTTGYSSGSYLNFVHFFNENDGVSGGDPVGGYFEVYTTSNGGANWTRVPSTSLPTLQPSEYGWTNGFDVSGNTICFTTSRGRIFKSTDRGVSWTASATGLASATKVFLKNDLVAFAFDINTTDYSLTGAKKTVNGGTTWTTFTPPTNMKKYLLEFVPGSTSTWISCGAKTGELGMSISTDDAASWTLKNSDFQFVSIAFKDFNIGWIGSVNSSGAPAIGGIYKWNNLTGVDDKLADNFVAIEVFPNPAYDKLNISCANSSKIERVDIYNLLGKKVYSKTYSQNTNTDVIIDISILLEGMYILNTTVNGVQNSTKFLIQK